MLALSVALLIARLPTLRADHKLESVISREATFLFNNLLLLALAFAVLWGVVFPILSEAVRGRPGHRRRAVLQLLPRHLRPAAAGADGHRAADRVAAGVAGQPHAHVPLADRLGRGRCGAPVAGRPRVEPGRADGALVVRVRHRHHRDGVRARDGGAAGDRRRHLAAGAARPGEPQPAPLRRLRRASLDRAARGRGDGVERVLHGARGAPGSGPVDRHRRLHAAKRRDVPAEGSRTTRFDFVRLAVSRQRPRGRGARARASGSTTRARSATRSTSVSSMTDRHRPVLDPAGRRRERVGRRLGEGAGKPRGRPGVAGGRDLRARRADHDLARSAGGASARPPLRGVARPQRGMSTVALVVAVAALVTGAVLFVAWPFASPERGAARARPERGRPPPAGAARAPRRGLPGPARSRPGAAHGQGHARRLRARARAPAGRGGRGARRARQVGSADARRTARGGFDGRFDVPIYHALQGQGQQGARQGRGPGGDARLQLPEAARDAAEGQARRGRRGHLQEAPAAADGEARGEHRQARRPGPPGARRQP